MNRPEFNPIPLTLSSDKVILRPLVAEDAAAFFAAGKHPMLWRWVAPNRCTSLETAKRWIAHSLVEQQNGQHIPFAIIDRESGKLVGSTRYCSIRRADRNLEIGFTFISPDYQRSYVNTHAKFLLLEHGFERLGAIRVEFRTHEMNEKSRNAIQRIGARFEGILRNARILEDGSLRNTAMFSVIEQEWPEVKRALRAKLEGVS